MIEQDDKTRRRGATEGNKNAWFWGRPDVEEARRVLDLWATAKWHERSGGEGVVTAEAVFEKPGIRFEVLREGLQFFAEVHRKNSTGQFVRGAVPIATAAEVMVDQVLNALRLKRLQKQGIWEGLLLHLYPRSGLCQRFPDDYRTYRPRGLLNGLTGKYLERSTDAFLRQIEREILINLIDAGQHPQDYYFEEPMIRALAG